jgi:hypothetical protein
MKNPLRAIVGELTNEEIKSAFLELREWRDTGLLSNGIVRKCHSLYEKQMGFEIDLSVMEKAILFELGDRALQHL